MNKTITLIDLLGMASEGKKMPNKIKFEGNTYKLTDYGYEAENGDCLYGMINYDGSNLNEPLEIIEDNDKLEKIKWNEKESRAGILRADQEIEVLAKRTETLKKKIAELVDHINKIEEALNVSKDN